MDGVPAQRLADLEQRIVAANVRATRCCAQHDVEGEWWAECELQDLYEQRDALLPPAQREALE